MANILNNDFSKVQDLYSNLLNELKNQLLKEICDEINSIYND